MEQLLREYKNSRRPSYFPKTFGKNRTQILIEKTIECKTFIQQNYFSLYCISPIRLNVLINMHAVTQLLQLFELTPISKNTFSAQNQHLGLPQIFGGQLMAQALRAAQLTLQTPSSAHAFHMNFIQAGEVNEPLVIQCKTLRDGKSFTLINVEIQQSKGIICCANISFQEAETGFDYSCAMPLIEAPTELASENQFILQVAESLPEPMRSLFSVKRPFEVKSKYQNNPFKGKILPANQQLWVTLAENQLLSDEMQQCLFLYFSDFHCLPTILQPHGKGALEPDIRMATLSHSCYFHRPFNFNEWIAVFLESPTSASGRGFCQAQAYSQNGEIIASYQQEAMIRLK